MHDIITNYVMTNSCTHVSPNLLSSREGRWTLSDCYYCGKIMCADCREPTNISSHDGEQRYVCKEPNYVCKTIKSRTRLNAGDDRFQWMIDAIEAENSANGQ